MNKTKMQMVEETGSDFWNDSCSIKELSEAVAQGAVGATTNPVIVFEVVKKEEDRVSKILEALFKNNPKDSEAEITWKLIETMGKEAAHILQPAFEKHNGKKGRLSLQVNPEFYMNAEKMIDHATHLSSIAPNMAIKIPCTESGLEVVEEITAKGIVVNVTVSFSVPQAIYAAEAIERGLKKAKSNGIDINRMAPYVTIMVGRLDDQLKRAMNDEKITTDPGYLEWAGVACFKKAYKIFKEKNYKSTLLSAAYRNHMHWSEFLGGNIVVSMPYVWWNKFNNSDVEVLSRIDKDVDKKIIDELYKKFKDFRISYDEDGMKPSDFIKFGSTINTLNQFISGYYQLIDYVRVKRLK
jgi:transaldolase